MNRNAFRLNFPVVLTAIGMAAFLSAPTAFADGDGAASVGSNESAATASSGKPIRLPLYKPPKVGKPARTVGGGSRGPGDGYPDVYVLVPAHVAQTAMDQPSLFWYLDEVPKDMDRVVFTLLDEDGIEPLVEVSLKSIDRPGIHRIKLSDYGVKLEQGIEYEWSVSLVPNAASQATGVTATGWIDRVKASPAQDQASVYDLAASGLWYDALATLDEQIASQPGNGDAVKMRAALLRQVGLVAVADATL
jgi:hypothetical protein